MTWFVEPDSELFTRVVWTRVALFTGGNGITRHEGFVNMFRVHPDVLLTTCRIRRSDR